MDLLNQLRNLYVSYMVPHEEIDTLRLRMFQQGQKALEMLPPTEDAFELHLGRGSFQANIWLHANIAQIDSDVPTATGSWKKHSDGIQIVWNRLPSVPST